MTKRFKISLAAAVAVVTMATAAPMLMAQDQPQRRQGPGMGGQRGTGGGQVDGPRGQGGGPGMRGGGPGMRGGGPLGFGPGFRALDLTDDQKAQLKKIRDARQAEFKAAGDKLGAARQSMRTLVDGDAINEGAIRAKSAEVAAAEADLMILNAKVRQESMQVLTSEQLAKLKEVRTGRQGQMKQRRGPRGQ